MAQRPPPLPSRAESGVEVKGYKPRRFPWRLWLYGVFMAAVAAAGGYFVWQYRSKAADANDSLGECDKKVLKAAGTQKDLDACNSALGSATTKVKELGDQVALGSKNLTANEAELVALRSQKAESDKRAAAIEDIQKQFA